MNHEEMFKGREATLNDIAQAYIDVKNEKAQCVMIVIKDGFLNIHSGNMTGNETMLALAEANNMVVKQMDDYYEGLYQKLQEITGEK